MNLIEISENIKINIDEISVEEIKQQFIQFAQLVLQQHQTNERQKEKQLLIERINNGASPRPVLVVNVGIEGFDPNEVNQYIQNVSETMNSAVPYSEYVNLIVPHDGKGVYVEMLSPLNMDDESKAEFVEKYEKLEKIIQDFFVKEENN